MANNHNIKHINFNSDKEQLSRVFFNLIKNSIESIQQKAENISNFSKNISIELNEDDGHIELIINDNGVGFKNLNKHYFPKNILIAAIKRITPNIFFNRD